VVDKISLTLNEECTDTSLPKGYICCSCCTDESCNDNNPCNGIEICNKGTCLTYEPAEPIDILCPKEQPFCNSTTKRCVQCLKTADCPQLVENCYMNPVCNSSGSCVYNTCKSNEVCDSGKCVECNIDNDCNYKITCDAEYECKSHICAIKKNPCEDEKRFKHCDPTVGKCGECLKDTDCKTDYCDGKQICMKVASSLQPNISICLKTHSCKEKDGGVNCNRETNKCVQCVTNEDCAKLELPNICDATYMCQEDRCIPNEHSKCDGNPDICIKHGEKDMACICQSDDNCTNTCTHKCDTVKKICVRTEDICKNNKKCKPGHPSSCVECLIDSDCTSECTEPAKCQSDTNVCEVKASTKCAAPLICNTKKCIFDKILDNYGLYMLRDFKKSSTDKTSSSLGVKTSSVHLKIYSNTKAQFYGTILDEKKNPSHLFAQYNKIEASGDTITLTNPTDSNFPSLVMKSKDANGIRTPSLDQSDAGSTLIATMSDKYAAICLNKNLLPDNLYALNGNFSINNEEYYASNMTLQYIAKYLQIAGTLAKEKDKDVYFFAILYSDVSDSATGISFSSNTKGVLIDIEKNTKREISAKEPQETLSVDDKFKASFKLDDKDTASALFNIVKCSGNSKPFSTKGSTVPNEEPSSNFIFYVAAAMME
jgi:hypothetical protein